jgi:hypothetical protein
MAVALDFGIDAPWVKSLPVNIATSSSDGVHLEKELSHAD